MELVPIISKEGFIVSSLHDLTSIPSSPYILVPYAFYTIGHGKPLYILYYIEKHTLWNDLLLGITGRTSASSSKLEYVMNTLKSIEVYMWDELRIFLESISKSVLGIYEDMKNKIIDYIGKVFGFTKLFEKAHIIFGFNPLPRHSYGSMLYFDDKETVATVYVNDTQKPEEVLDIIIHEILHGLIRLNNIELEDEVEELVIDTACPEGYLSKLIGLTDKVNINDIKKRFAERHELVEYITAYYINEKYRETSIIEWIKEKL